MPCACSGFCFLRGLRTSGLGISFFSISSGCCRRSQKGGSSLAAPPPPPEAHGSLPPPPPELGWLPPAGGLAHGSLPPPPEPPWPCQPPDPAPERVVFATLAVALRRLGPTSSTSISKTVRFSPSRVSYCRDFRRPWTIARMPFCSVSATFSAAWRHTEQVRKSVSPSRHSPD